MRGRWVRRHRLVGVVLGVTPAFFVIGAVDCIRTNPGFLCSIVRFVFDE